MGFRTEAQPEINGAFTTSLLIYLKIPFFQLFRPYLPTEAELVLFCKPI